MATVLNPDEVERENLKDVDLPLFWKTERQSPVKSSREWWNKVLAPQVWGEWREATITDNKARILRSLSAGVVTYSLGAFTFIQWGLL